MTLEMLRNTPEYRNASTYERRLLRYQYGCDENDIYPRFHTITFAGKLETAVEKLNTFYEDQFCRCKEFRVINTNSQTDMYGNTTIILTYWGLPL